MFTTLLVVLPLKPLIKRCKGFSKIFFGPLDLTIMVFIEWLGIFVVSWKSLVAWACFPPRNKVLLYVPSGLFVPWLEMKPGKFLFGIASPLAFLSIGLLGKGLVFTLFSLCMNQCPFKDPLLSRTSGKLGRLSSLGYVGLVMSFEMDSLSTSKTFGGLPCLPSRVLP